MMSGDTTNFSCNVVVSKLVVFHVGMGECVMALGKGLWEHMPQTDSSMLCIKLAGDKRE